VVVQATGLAGRIHNNPAVFCGRAVGIVPVVRDVSRCRMCCCVVWVCGEGVVMMTDSHKAVVQVLRAKSFVMREHNSHATKTHAVARHHLTTPPPRRCVTLTP
jgi:hypothetical protein